MSDTKRLVITEVCEHLRYCGRCALGAARSMVSCSHLIPVRRSLGKVLLYPADLQLRYDCIKIARCWLPTSTVNRDMDMESASIIRDTLKDYSWV